ncbi:HlyD family efflux transporter periplasmic adaptor subunit [Kordiimonas aestuarii]|uniref:HlyD family efflux transporter periplasmic adaptor subunit n=1 Tax=Kordiimonas aestuarii TaxID=1005925 RepID=UPI0021CF3EA7|nr:HlyD family efflux transporter periplasmic adaptor subunit [Kordiimonas aestuarii]
MFRAEAVNAQKKKLHGDVFLTQPMPFTVVSLLLCGIVAIFVLLLGTGSYARTEHVSGHLVPSKGLVKIQASQFGTLEALHVQEGDMVEKGQPLAAILVSATGQDGDSFAKKALEAIVRQQSTLDTQTTLEQNQLEAEIARLTSERAKTNLNIKSLARQIELQRQITSSAESAYKDVQELLGKGYISKIESERRHQTWLGQQTQEQLKRQELAAAKTSLEQIDIRLRQLPNESEQRLARLDTQRAELEARKAELEGRRAYVINSHTKGKVVAVAGTSIGRSVQAGQPLLTILPEGSSLEAELFVPSRAAGFVEEGQEVRLLYDAFPYQRFGSYPATVRRVTGTILSPREILSPFELQEPVYRVTASIPAEEIEVRNRLISLQSGMTLRANIVLERRSFLDWLLEPLRAVGERS